VVSALQVVLNLHGPLASHYLAGGKDGHEALVWAILLFLLRRS